MSAIEPLLVVIVVVCGFRPSSRCLWMLAFVPIFFCRFLKPPRAGEVLPKFSIVTNVLPFYAGGGPGGGTSVTPIVFVSVAGLPAPRRGATAPTRFEI